MNLCNRCQVEYIKATALKAIWMYLNKHQRDLLHHLDTHRFVGLDEIPPRVLKELVDVLSKPLSTIYQQSWLTEEAPVFWKLANVTKPIAKKG